ncbi:unnamed protein product [Cylindrotheca closterium]|uniref:Uncharacterized protein n=1 Tax=Cylindrotheca closterium TaxID=2856 RepID=A0AAD2FKC2_9STRA|nr:unnamed protein product [Cylindrotheca closterium]
MYLIPGDLALSRKYHENGSTLYAKDACLLGAFATFHNVPNQKLTPPRREICCIALKLMQVTRRMQVSILRVCACFPFSP